MNTLQNNLAELEVNNLFAGNKPMPVPAIVLTNSPQENDALLPCPFCGGTPHIWKVESDVVIRCSGCWATHKTAFFDMADLTHTTRDLSLLIQGVVGKWNRRTGA